MSRYKEGKSRQLFPPPHTQTLAGLPSEKFKTLSNSIIYYSIFCGKLIITPANHERAYLDIEWPMVITELSFDTR